MTLERSSCAVTIAGSASVLADAAGDGIVRTVDGARIEGAVRPRLRKKIDRFTQIALMATDRLKPHFDGVARDRVGIFLGNDLAGWNYVHAQLERLIESRDPLSIDPYVATAWFPAAAQGEITIAHGLLGHSKTFSAGYLSGGVALEYAARRVADGSLAVALAGGVEAPNAPAILDALTAEGRIDAGHPAGEAAGMLTLRSRDQLGIARMTISSPRRRLEIAVDDVVDALGNAETVYCLMPSVAPENHRWSRAVSDIESVLTARFGSRLTRAAAPQRDMDVGSASFPLAAIAASEMAAKGQAVLVAGADFDGLFLASAVTPMHAGEC